MHELSIALSIIEVAEEEIARLGAHHVNSIYVRIGELSGVGKQSLNAAFELASENTPCAKSRLVFEDIAVLADCPVCRGPQSIVSLQQFNCAICCSPVSN